MTREELEQLVDHVNGCWNLTPFKEDLAKQRRTWFRFFGDISLEKAMAAVDAHAVTEKFQPRPGELRRRVLIGKIPSAMEAWAELQSAREAVYGGQMATPMSEATTVVVKKLGDQARGMHTNGDRDKFIEMFDTVIREWIEEKCAVPSE